MAPRWRLKATTIEGGFALRLIGDGDLGEAFDDADSVAVEMEDGRSLRLYDALVAMIDGRVTGFIVLTQRVDQRKKSVEPALEDRAP